MAISLKIINPPVGINENQFFLDQAHMNEWLDTHADKLPGLRVENGEAHYDVNAVPVQRTAAPLNDKLPPNSPLTIVKPVPAEKILVKKLSVWQKIVIFVKNILGIK